MTKSITLYLYHALLFVKHRQTSAKHSCGVTDSVFLPCCPKQKLFRQRIFFPPYKITPVSCISVGPASFHDMVTTSLGTEQRARHSLNSYFSNFSLTPSLPRAYLAPFQILKGHLHALSSPGIVIPTSGRNEPSPMFPILISATTFRAGLSFQC